MDEQKINRKNKLNFFDKFLNFENKDHICFICGERINDSELSRDHVIPWSYMYSDDLWNLVYVHKSCNSSKTNRLPNEESIQKLKERNLKMQKELSSIWEEIFGNKYKNILGDLNIAIEQDYVDKFYLGYKGS